MSTSKKLLFSLLPLLLLTIALELVLRVAYFQTRSDNTFALQSLYEKLRLRTLNRNAEEIKKQLEVLGTVKQIELLYQSEGQELFADFQRQYEDDFKVFLEEAKRIQTKVYVLFVPADDYKNSYTLEPSRKFFGELAKKYKLPFIDMTPIFMGYPVEVVTLLPENGHLSRFGNYLVAKEVGKVVLENGSYRSSMSFSNRPKLLGDLAPNDKKVWYMMDSIPFRAITNSQGLRMDHDISFPKKKQHILTIGDSFTFGPYLPIFHSYPYLLSKMLPEKEVINAGVAGYTISDEAALFTERAKYTEPDITVLQVLDNDLTGYFYFSRNEFERGRRSFLPSKLEKEYFEKLKKASKIIQ